MKYDDFIILYIMQKHDNKNVVIVDCEFMLHSRI